MGTERLNRKVMEDYLQTKQKSYGIYQVNNGAEWLHKVFVEADITNFDYYYGKLKKMTLLRTYDEIGMDVSWIYNPDNILDIQKKEEQSRKLDEMSLSELADMIDNRVTRVREIVVDNDIDESCSLGDGLRELVASLETKPIIGNPLFDPYLDRIAMGARTGCFYLRSASTGTGKSRTAMADACYLACDQYYDRIKGLWVSTGTKQPTLFISVELDKSELQTMALSFIADVPEDHIVRGEMLFEEKERIDKAIKIIEESPLKIEYLPDYGIADIENCIKRNLRTNQTSYVMMDYITSSMKIIEEITRASGGMKIREDQVLFLLSSKLKDLATKYNIFIFSATQTNASFKTEKILDQNALAGAKSIANRIDFGSIMVDVTEDDLSDIQYITDNNPNLGIPNIKMSVYKNRRGEYNRVILWMRADKSTCKYRTLFVTDFNFNLINNIMTRKDEDTDLEEESENDPMVF